VSDHLIVILLALLIGVVAGLRSLTAPAVVAWAAHLGSLPDWDADHGWHNWYHVAGTWAGWLASTIAVVILTVLALGELVNDKLPKTPPRTAPPVFAVRIIMGGFAGAVLGGAILKSHHGLALTGLGAGMVGAVLGTLGGYQARKRLVALIGGKDLPIALLEDAVAVFGGLGVVAAVAAL
jgi:uncharacterized membrane protein